MRIYAIMQPDPRISPIFYYFAEHTDVKTGRTVGRKIGVIQEIIIKKFLNTNKRIRDCLIYEPKLRGKSGATHKVEFVLFSPIFVVELAIDKKFRFLDPSIQISLDEIEVEQKKIKVSISTGQLKAKKILKLDTSLTLELIVEGKATKVFLKLVELTNKSCKISLLNGEKPIASIESKRVGAQRFSGSEKLGSGIQTIEKAKQTSLVAVDFDLEFNDVILMSNLKNEIRKFKSFALLGNGVHWTDHDLSILQTYVDFTIQVKDEAIIRYAEFVRKISDEKNVEFFKFFMDYFAGMMVTPPDGFIVSGNDFLRLRPISKGENKNLVELVEMQIPEYQIIIE